MATIEEIHDAILADENLKALAIAGRDGDIVELLPDHLPREVVEHRMAELDILALYSDPQAGETVLQQIEAVAEANPIVKRVAKWMAPGAPGIDLGDMRVRGMLTLAAESGGLGLTPEQATPMLVAAERPASVTLHQVNKALRPHRNEGRASLKHWIEEPV